MITVVSVQRNNGVRRVVWRNTETGAVGVVFGSPDEPIDELKRRVDSAKGASVAPQPEPTDAPEPEVDDETEAEERAEKRRPRPQPKRSN